MGLNFNSNKSCVGSGKWYLVLAMTAIDTKDGIQMYRLLAIKHGLKLELLGIRHSRNLVFKAAKQITGKKTRIACLTIIEEMIKNSLP